MALDVRGKTVVLTGTFSKLKRAEAEKQLAALGAKIGSSVGKSTHVLFAGEKAGSKIDAAGRLGITVLGEDELMALLAGPKKKKAPARSSRASSSFASLDPKVPGPALTAAIEALPWDDFEADRDLSDLREVLYAHEAAHGITAAHRAATARLRPRATLQHAHGHDVEVSESELSPDGRFLATGSWVGDDYDHGGVLQIWDVRAGRCVNMLRVRGGVGWPDHGGCIQWRPDGKRVGLAFDTNGVGSFDPFGASGEPDSCAYVTDGWNRPPSWAWSSNSRDVYIACWGPNLALGAIVPLVGRRPAPRWCQSTDRSDPNDPHSEPRLHPMGGIDWSHPDRIVGTSGLSHVFALDAKTGKILWEQKAHPPVSFSPDGNEFVMHPAGIVYYDASTGLPNGKLPMHVGAASLLYSRDGARLAAIVQPENEWRAEPGIFIYDRGTYRYSLDVPAPRTDEDETYEFSWRPDGRAAAILVGGRLQVWELGDAPAKRLDIAAPSGGVAYGDGVLVSNTAKGLVFFRDHDGAELGRFRPAIEASGDSPLALGGDDFGSTWDWNPAFPLDGERVAAALPEGVVIGPPDASASVAEIDAKIAWVIDRKWAWPWRWGEAKVWPDAAAAAADPAASASFKRKFGKKGKAPARPQKVKWPPPGGSIDDVAALVEEGIKSLRVRYHGDNYRREFAERVMALGLFDRAAAALDGTGGWPKWDDPWFSARARGETVVAALAWRKGEALTDAQTKTLRRWLEEAEKLLTKKEAKQHSASRPQAMIGAGWVLLGEKARGDKLLSSAIATVDPETNASENRGVVAEALAAVGRIHEAIDMIASGDEKPSWTETRAVFSAICPRASAAELKSLVSQMKERDAHNEFELLDRGLSRLIALKEWDAAVSWLSEFDGLSTTVARLRLAAAMAAAGEPARAEAAMAEELVPKYESSAKYLLGLARVAPERAGKHFETILKAAPKLRKQSLDFPCHLAGAAAALGRLDIAAKLEKGAPNKLDVFEVRVGVLGSLDPSHPEWMAWFTRAREQLEQQRKPLQRMAALASRGGLADECTALLDQAIEMARGEGYPDIVLQEVSAVMAAAGDLAGAHRAFMAISKGMRSYRNGPLLSAAAERGLWAATVDILRQMPQDLNGAPQRGLSILLKATDRDGF
ncbi:WD40 repeat domain-containing protein [Polyangium jinanense]|uniref:PQQ-binding-like beta-propeller repeat protein n=1 Tax=Polyangium jinanense TaxID=2829994 RepID=A0A9X3X8Q8_9BACT|nr:BRCT domain-containing protein [Polyangium jinanense]MDC3958890.1 PQQ-binding-like beta-propeller repeat protein [Polyangium jinanense]MDC3986004.1 PQQ-binding-like beta-propeller repeat protein [Polyangium jinanense]